MSKEAMKLALEALESVYQYGSDTLSGPVKGQSDDRKWQRDGVLEMTNRAYKPITAIKEALAQTEQEPVAVVSGYYGGQCVILPIDPARIFNSNTALYTSPPAQRKPLTPLEIENLRDEHLYSVQGVIQGHEAFTRAIEAKLKENT